MPLSENDAAAAAHYETVTDTLKLISDYTRLNFNEIMELDCCIYKLYFRDAYIYMMKQTKEGREYLENCWILQQTKPDRNRLRDRYN